MTFVLCYVFLPKIKRGAKLFVTSVCSNCRNR